MKEQKYESEWHLKLKRSCLADFYRDKYTLLIQAKYLLDEPFLNFARICEALLKIANYKVFLRDLFGKSRVFVRDHPKLSRTSIEQAPKRV